MKDTEYSYAVARVRVNETRLLQPQELASLLSAPTYEECVRRLKEKGYDITGTDYAPALTQKLADMWALISEILPDPAQFDSILIRNDFHNLKVCLKALVAEKSTDGLFAAPAKYAPEEIRKHVFARENDKLPEELRHADRSAYSILTKTGFAQLADTVIDRAAMEHAIGYAGQADHPVMLRLAQTSAALADIRVLYRCIKTDKAKSFMERAVCACEAFPKQDIIAAAQSGMPAFLEYLSHTAYADGAEALKESMTAFETWADDTLTDLLSAGKSEAFGIGALVGYYYAVRTEVLNVRILLSGKLNGLPANLIKERMRRLYV